MKRGVFLLHREKLISFILIFILFLISFSNIVYADDEIDETNISENEIEEIIQTTASTENIPAINSKYAVCLDRISRKNSLRKTRKY